jgi:hypothetical protein
MAAVIGRTIMGERLPLPVIQAADGQMCLGL